MNIEGINLRMIFGSGQKLTFPNFKFEGQDHLLLLGPSGSGKTTLLQLFGGLLSASGGKLTIDDKALSELTAALRLAFRRQYIGYIPQDFLLMESLTVLENIVLAQRIKQNKKDVEEAKQLLNTLDMTAHLHKHISKISHGQKQRVAIARALVGEPKYILADEPTASLDDHNCKEVMHLLLETTKYKKASLIMATHDGRVKNSFQQVLNLEEKI